MFEHYTERERRVIFFARYEASVLASSMIDTEHLLLGLLREGGGLAESILRRSGITHGFVSKALRAASAGDAPISTSLDIPLSPAARRALECAIEEAERLGSPHIDTEHLLVGLLQQPDDAAVELRRASPVGDPRVRFRSWPDCFTCSRVDGRATTCPHSGATPSAWRSGFRAEVDDYLPRGWACGCGEVHGRR